MLARRAKRRVELLAFLGEHREEEQERARVAEELLPLERVAERRVSDRTVGHETLNEERGELVRALERPLDPREAVRGEQAASGERVPSGDDLVVAFGLIATTARFEQARRRGRAPPDRARASRETDRRRAPLAEDADKMVASLEVTVARYREDAQKRVELRLVENLLYFLELPDVRSAFPVIGVRVVGARVPGALAEGLFERATIPAAVSR